VDFIQRNYVHADHEKVILNAKCAVDVAFFKIYTVPVDLTRVALCLHIREVPALYPGSETSVAFLSPARRMPG
jgi:hypothetical protein